jgi:hypothetical protein
MNTLVEYLVLNGFARYGLTIYFDLIFLDHIDCFWIKVMFLLKYSFGERFFVIVVVNGDSSL